MGVIDGDGQGCLAGLVELFSVEVSARSDGVFGEAFASGFGLGVFEAEFLLALLEGALGCLVVFSDGIPALFESWSLDPEVAVPFIKVGLPPGGELFMEVELGDVGVFEGVFDGGVVGEALLSCGLADGHGGFGRVCDLISDC